MEVRSKLERYLCRLRGKQIVHFLHIGKTGGTALKDVLQQYPETANSRIKLHPHGRMLREVPRGDKVVFFLRDPITRFVSGFLSRQREGRPRYHVPWSPDERIAFGRFSTPNELALALSSKDIDLREHAAHAMRTVQHVRSSYFDWFESEAYFLSRIADVLFIGFQERLDDDFQLLVRILRLDGAPQLPRDDVKAHRNPADLNRTLDDTARANLVEWYARDYVFMDLCAKQACRIRSAWEPVRAVASSAVKG